MREDHSEEEEMKYELEKETFQTESTLFCKRALATTKKMIVILNLLSRGSSLPPSISRWVRLYVNNKFNMKGTFSNCRVSRFQIYKHMKSCHRYV